MFSAGSAIQQRIGSSFKLLDDSEVDGIQQLAISFLILQKALYDPMVRDPCLSRKLNISWLVSEQDCYVCHRNYYNRISHSAAQRTT